MNNEIRLRKLTLVLLCSALTLYLTGFAAKYLLTAFFPFLAAWAVAISLRKPSEILAKHMRIPVRVASAILLILVSLLAGYLIFLVFSILVREGRELYQRIVQNTSEIEYTVKSISDMLGNVARKIPYFGKSPTVISFTEHFDEKLLSVGADYAPKLLSALASLLGRLAKAIPYFALFLLVTIIAAFYFCTDLARINRSAAGILPKKHRQLLFTVKEEIFSVIFGYFRAYSLIIALTFTELFIGLSIIGIEYSFLISFIIALVDILPVLGAGMVLIPWGVALIVFGNLSDGVCILVLYLVITVIRQLAEPKIVGSFLGLHPLVTLLAMYVGMRLAGVLGLFLFPIAAIVTRNVYKRNREDNGSTCQ